MTARRAPSHPEKVTSSASGAYLQLSDRSNTSVVLLFLLRRPSSLQHQSDDTIADDQDPLQVSPKWQPDAPSHPPMEAPMEELLRLCRENQWNKVLENVKQHPPIGNYRMTMSNHVKTTIIHQAIASKGDTADRAKVISTILQQTPEAAQTKNGLGSLPLHAIAQRNTKIDATTKERLIEEIMDAYPDALTVAAGKGMRTPVHIIFTSMVMLFISHCFKNSHCICMYRQCVGPPYETHG
jgi:hypothetical protein